MEINKAVDLLDNLIGMVDDNQGNDYDAAFHMAIDALKAQADGVTISRQAAIDALSCENPTETYIDYDDAVKAIRRLHSAEPETHEERTETHSCDLISRQEYESRIKPYDTEDSMDKALYNFAHNILICCPSAEPEKRTITECPMCPDCPDNCPLVEVEHDSD